MIMTEKENKWTPSPWRFENFYIRSTLHEGSHNICEIDLHWGENRTCGRANGQLIAAAPELYEALTAAFPIIERAATEEARANRAPRGLPPQSTQRTIHDNAKAAIAKARGEKGGV